MQRPALSAADPAVATGVISGNIIRNASVGIRLDTAIVLVDDALIIDSPVGIELLNGARGTFTRIDHRFTNKRSKRHRRKRG